MLRESGLKEEEEETGRRDGDEVGGLNSSSGKTLKRMLDSENRTNPPGDGFLTSLLPTPLGSSPPSLPGAFDTQALNASIRAAARSGTLFPLKNPPKPNPNSPSRIRPKSIVTVQGESSWGGPTPAPAPATSRRPSSSRLPSVPDDLWSRKLDSRRPSQEFSAGADSTSKPNRRSSSHELSDGLVLKDKGKRRERPPLEVGSLRSGSSSTSSQDRSSSGPTLKRPSSLISESSQPPSVFPSRRSQPSIPLPNSPRPSGSSTTGDPPSSRNSVAISISSFSSHSPPSRPPSSFVPQQSIFQNPGHKPRAISDFIPKPKFSRFFRNNSSPPEPIPIAIGGKLSGGRRAKSSDILDAALMSSQSWYRPVQTNGAESVYQKSVSIRSTGSQDSTPSTSGLPPIMNTGLEHRRPSATASVTFASGSGEGHKTREGLPILYSGR